ncbi:hypothetical protein GN244_ATG02687 [Phytophthora infestans]|uniref:Uncharacterized protein n=1 Tax=Phytophthora infestans TaxID=4787 RepID=A0A833TKM8_PHYIN|nr:hypothetical protein GN244_ATG02687 [Phytophthora infestans]
MTPIQPAGSAPALVDIRDDDANILFDQEYSDANETIGSSDSSADVGHDTDDLERHERPDYDGNRWEYTEAETM